MEILRCESLTKTYQSGGAPVHALQNVSLSFAQSSFTAVTGKSGSGKSTLLHMLSGLDRPTSGKIIYQDNDLSKYNDNQLSVLRRRRFGFVFQSYNLVRELTAQENILLPVMLDSRKPDEKHLTRLIEILGIGDRLSHLPGAMSGGQQQRVCIARALANKPAILFADEPTGNLDGKTGREVLTLLRTVSQELGITMILVTHDLGVAEQAERIIRLEDGQVADDSGEDEDSMTASGGNFIESEISRNKRSPQCGVAPIEAAGVIP